ncbi:MAG: Yip1 family protein [Chloroflexota bacterium]
MAEESVLTGGESVAVVPNKGWFGRLVDTIISPDRSFEVIRDHKSWTWVFTALLIIVAASFPQIIIIQRTIQQFQAAGPQLPPGIEVSEEELEMMQASTPTFTFWFGLIGVVVGLLIIWVIWAGIILLFVSMFGGRAEFGRLWRLAIWASLPLAIQGVLGGIYLLVAGGMQPLLLSAAAFLSNPMEQFASGNISPDDFASFVPPSAGELALFSLAGFLDVFVIWRLLLMILGVMIVAKLNWKKSAAIILIPWLIGVGIAVGSASLVSQFTF